MKRATTFLFILAIWLFPLAIQAGNDQIPRILDKAGFYLEKGNVLSASDYLARARGIDPNDPDVLAFAEKLRNFVSAKVADHMRQAEFFASNKQVPQAIEQYNLVLRYVPGHPEATARLAKLIEIKTKVKNLKDSGIIVAPGTGRAYDLNAYSVVSELMKAKSAFNNGDYQRAMELIDGILGNEPTCKEALAMKQEITKRQEFRDLVSGASNKAKNGDFRQAEEYYTRLLELQSDKVELLILRGRARIRLEKYEEGLDDFLNAMRKGGKLEEMRKEIVTGMVGIKDYPRALGLAGSFKNNPACEPISFRIWCFWKSYRVSCSLFIFTIFLFIGAVVWVSHNLGSLLEKGRFYHIRSGIVCLFKCLMGDPELQTEKLRVVARQLNHPWFHYFSGLLLITQNRLEQAQEHLQGALSSGSLAPRAYFFLGLIRGRMKLNLSLHDFEQTLVLGLKEHPVPWIPVFVASVEKKLLNSMTKEEKTDELVVLAFKTMTCLSEAS